MPRQAKNSYKKQRRIPRQARAREKYTAILAACPQLLLERGYAGTTMLELSLSSGVAVPTIYQYFPGKDAIFQAWLEHLVDAILEQTELLSQHLSAEPLEEQVRTLLKHTASQVGDNHKSIHSVFAELPQALSVEFLSYSEQKTLNLVFGLLEPALGGPVPETIARQLRVLTRCVLGYFVQAALAHPGALASPDEQAAEIDELCKLVNLALNLSHSPEKR